MSLQLSRFLGRLHDDAIHAQQQEASKKRQGTKSREVGHPTVRRRFACARLSRPYLPGSCPDFSATLTTTAFDRSSLRWFWISDLIAEPEGPAFISSTVTQRRLDRRYS